MRYVLTAAAMVGLMVHVLNQPARAQESDAPAPSIPFTAAMDANAGVDANVAGDANAGSDANAAVDPNADVEAPVTGGRNGDDASGPSLGLAVSLLGKGFAYTLGIAVGSIGLGFLLSVPVGVVLNANRGIGYFLVRSVVDFLRGTPVMVQLYFVFYMFWDAGLRVLPITAAILTLALNAMAYMAEVVRSGLMSVDPGQRYAGRALGLSRWQVFRLVVWPQAFRIALPPLMNSVVALIKDTALVSIIGVAEVVQAAQTLYNIDYQPSKWYLIVAVMFFCVTFPLMKLAGWLETKIREKGFA
jgi:His/Glu/Gln/Arg/opine family amino acid ABC transporter permease subunit